MADEKKKKGFNIDIAKLVKQPTMIFATFLVIIVLMLIIPLPAFMLDLLMSISILFGVFIIISVAYVNRPVNFSIFPTLLLVSTLFRLSVNVSSTRLILSQGINFNGKMVRAFGRFVVGSADLGGMIIGIIIFAVLVLVQFLVITKGATRVSEVAARFALDAMPNKFMAIDMDVNNGVITETEALHKREALQEESQFYGNMDGASKFVQGDVIVGLIITFVNILGGFAVGMIARGESFSDALANYIPLTIGDGLVSQIPSLLISTATGLIVTRSQSTNSIGEVIWKQTRQYRVFFIAGGTLGVLAFLPGFPHIILLLLAAGLITVGFFLYQADQKKIKGETKDKHKDEKKSKGPENVSSLLKIDPLSLYIGYALIPLVSQESKQELLNSITKIRRNLALELGVLVPPIRIQDNMNIAPNEYSFRIRGQEVGRGEIKINYLMAMGEGREEIEGEKTTEPAFGLPAVWIREDLREKAEGLGYTVVDPATIISTHIQELLTGHAFEILSREEVHKILDTVKEDYPNLVNDIMTINNYKEVQIQKVLQQLLKEGVSIRDMVTILETMSEHSAEMPISDLVEYIRQSLRRALTNKFVEDGKMFVLKFDPAIENEVYKNLAVDNDGEPVIRLHPDYLHKLQIAISEKVSDMINKNLPAIILCQAPVRRAFFEICYRINSGISVLSMNEIIADVNVELFGQITLEKVPVNS